MPTTYWQRKLLALGTIFLGLIPLFTLGTRLAASAQDNVAATALDGGYGGTSPLLPPPQQPYSVTIGQAPTVTISSPANRATFIQGTVISFTGTVTDVEDGDLTANLAWLSSLDGGIGSGGSFTRTNLSVGAHIITATVTDSGGMTGTDSVSITIFADVPVLVGAGDIANDRDRDEATATLLDGIPGTVVTLGDNAYPDGAPDEFANYYHPTWGRHLARTRPATGNREYNTSNASGHFGYFGAAAGDPTKGYYSFDVHSWHIIVLNTECSEVGGCGPSSPQYLWLQADLAAHANLCTLAIMHKPVYSSKNASNAGDDFWTLFYFESVDVVLSGHAHFYERFAPQDSIGVADATHGVRQFVVGTGGTSLTSAGTAIANSEVLEKKTYGVLKLTLHPTSYDWQFVPIAGQTFTDSGTYPCGVTPPPNKAPLANDDSATTDEDTSRNINVADNDRDAHDNLDPASANSTCANGSAGCNGAANGTLTDNGNGTITYTPDNNFNGSDSFVYEICDSAVPALCSTASVTITVNPVNDPPVPMDDSDSTPEDTAVIIDVAANDTDPEANLDPSSANGACANGSSGCSGAANGTLSDNGDGTITYTPDTNFNGSDSFVYEICDTDNACQTGSVTVVVTPLPDPPAAADDSATVAEDGSRVIDAAANDTDPEGDLIPATANTACANGSAGCSDPANGILSNNGDGTFTYTPDPDFDGADSFVYEICDATSLCDTASVAITVTPLPDPPVANDDGAITSEAVPVTVDVAANDTDVDGDLAPATANTACDNGSTGCASPANGVLSNLGNGSFSYAPAPGFVGNDTFVYEICDATSLCDTAAVSITVLPHNDPPTANDDTGRTLEDIAVTIDVAANDTDPNGNLDPASANTTCANGSSGCQGAANGTLSDNGDGSITYTPNPGFSGADSFVYEICDTVTRCDTATVSITVPPTVRNWLPIVMG